MEEYKNRDTLKKNYPGDKRFITGLRSLEICGLKPSKKIKL
jgi:hypothetical protein